MLIGVVTAKFNSEFTLELEKGALSTLEKAGLSKESVWTVRVPGAVEIPLTAKAMLEQGCDAVITLGAVIRGDTAHFDYVCQSVERGVTHLMLETGKPVIFGVLTTENEEQALARTIGEHGNKGADAATTALEMLALLSEIKRGFAGAPQQAHGKDAKSKNAKNAKSSKNSKNAKKSKNANNSKNSKQQKVAAKKKGSKK